MGEPRGYGADAGVGWSLTTPGEGAGMTSAQQCQFRGFNAQGPNVVHCEEAVVVSGQSLCPLHDPSPDKDIAAFRTALEKRLVSSSTTSEYELGGVIFPELFDFFKGKAIDGPVNLSQAIFLGPSDFSGCEFRGGTSAYQTRFYGAVDFANAQLSGGSLFAEAEFIGVAIFNNCVFAGDVSFDRARFADLAMWQQTRFGITARFDEAIFVADADFTGATIAGTLRMTRTKLPPLDSEAVVYFRHLIIDQEASVTLNGVDLARVSFNGTLLAQFKFIGCQWAHVSSLGRKRAALFDEIVHDASVSYRFDWPTYAEVGDLYRQLRINLESTRQEIEAGDFYVGQMEMRRRSADYARTFRFVLGGYNILAGYGESWIRPILYYVTVAAAFGLAYLLAGFKDINGELIHYRTADDWFVTGQFWKDFAQAFAHALAAAGLLQQSLSFESWWAPLVRFGNAIWDLLVLSLIVVALRRKFHK